MMMANSKVTGYFFLICLTTLYCGILFGQDSTGRKTRSIHITMGLGSGSGIPHQGNSGVIGGNIEFSVQQGNNLLSIGSRGITEVQFLGRASHVGSVDLMYGRILQKGIFVLIVSSGVSWIRSFSEDVEPCAGCSYRNFYSENYGFPVSLKTFILIEGKPVGIEFFSNMNNVKFFYGINITTKLGIRFKRK